MSSATVSRSRPLALTLRDLHSNISAFIAPVVIFYAISGALQIFDLHESHGGYVAPTAVASMARLHKNQVFAPPPQRRGESPGGGAGPGAGGPGGRPSGGGSASGGPDERTLSPATLALKWLFLIEALGLAVTTIVGVWIGVTHAKRKRTMIVLLLSGTILPLVLICFSR